MLQSLNDPAFTCAHCGKGYMKKNGLDKHVILCELLAAARNKSRADVERDEEFEREVQSLSQKKIYLMLIELGEKYKHLEEKFDRLQHRAVTTDANAANVDYVAWLNARTDIRPPTHTFETITDGILVSDAHVAYLLDNGFASTLAEVFTRATLSPLIAIEQKPNIIYAYRGSTNTWTELEKEELIKWLDSKVHMKVINALMAWKNTSDRIQEINRNPIFAIKCDKALSNLMTVNFRNDKCYMKIRNMIYSKVKIAYA